MSDESSTPRPVAGAHPERPAEQHFQAPRHDDAYVRPIERRYLDPVELIWLATAQRLGLTVRRDPSIFSRTDGKGLLALGPRSNLDADDCVAQMILHELCHWITNGQDSFVQPDWGFELDEGLDVREHACLRLQATLTGRYGLQHMLGPTGTFRQYYDRILEHPLKALDSSDWERRVCELATESIARADGPPWAPSLAQALAATQAIRHVVRPFLSSYATELNDDTLPSAWRPVSTQ